MLMNCWNDACCKGGSSRFDFFEFDYATVHKYFTGYAYQTLMSFSEPEHGYDDSEGP